MNAHYGVVGTPVAGSLSPLLHTAVYAELGLLRSFERFDPCDEAGFRTFWERSRKQQARPVLPQNNTSAPYSIQGQGVPFYGAYDGFCVTTPYKMIAAELCDTLTDAAARIGAVNTVRREPDGSFTGDNTDAGGFLAALKSELGLQPQGLRVCLCGTGGVAQAIADVLTQGGAGAREITQVSRRGAFVDPAPSAGMARGSAGNHVFGSGDNSAPAFIAGSTLLTYDELLAEEQPFDLLINATPVGMNDDAMVVPQDWTHSYVDAVFDAVYRTRGTTPLVAAAYAAGLPACDGRVMLIEQAILGLHFWGITAGPTQLRSIMEQALTDAG